jgi:hypothetical protein
MKWYLQTMNLEWKNRHYWPFLLNNQSIIIVYYFSFIWIW